MKRLILFDWVRRHRIATVVPATVAAAVLIAWLSRSDGRSGAPLARAMAAHRSAEACLEHAQLADGDRECRRAIEILDNLAARSSDRQVRFEQAAALETLALIRSASEEPEKAHAFFRKAIGVWTRLLADDQAVALVRWRLARCLSRHATLLSSLGRGEEAENTLERGDNVCRNRVSSSPPDHRVDREWVLIKNQLGLSCLNTGRWARAIENFDSAASMQNRLTQEPEAAALDEETLISVLVNQAKAYSASREPEAALRKIGEARKLAEGLSAKHPSIGRYRDVVATLLEREAGEMKPESRGAARARELLERAVAIRESLVAGAPAEPGYLEKLADSCGMLAVMYLAAHSYAKAEEFERRELSYQLRLRQEHPGVMAYRFGRGRALNNLAELLRRRGRAEEALSLAREAAPLLESVYRENVLDEVHRRAASNAYWTLCALELDRKDHRAAAGDVVLYLSIGDIGFEAPHESAGFLCRCIVLCRDDHSLPKAEQESLAGSYADRAIGALQTAVRYGFRDLNALTSARVYDPLRHRADFTRIVRDVGATLQALKEG
jgi:tetratricopeptide (TPR) repeat protein